MFREIINPVSPAAARQVGWLGCAGTRPVNDGEFLADSGSSRHTACEGGNPCLGIAIGCVLSLPLWAGLVAVVYLLH